MVDAVMMPSSNTNCADDVDEFLLTLSSLDQKTDVDLVVPHSSAYDILMEQVPASVRDILSVCFLPEDETSLDKQEFNVLAYISGYIVRKLRNIVCDVCVTNITSDISEDNALLEAVAQIEVDYRKVIDEIMYSSHVKATLVSTLKKNLAFEGISCAKCNLELLLIHIMVNIRLHHTLRESNRSLVNCKDRKNRKVLKFSHL
jgi:ribonucleotide reductase beta subunit family protein with ferritin-like domain